MPRKKYQPISADQTQWFREIENYQPPKESEEPDTKPPKPKKPSDLVLPSDSFFITKELYDEFEARRLKEFPDIESLSGLNYNQETGEVTGSTSFIATYLNSFLPENYRTSTPLDLENILKANSFQLKGYYIDSGLVLRSTSEPNQHSAQHLMKQVKARLGNNLQLPLLIPLYGLELKADKDSPHRLSFNLKDNAELISALILSQDSAYFSSEDINERTGLPKELGEQSKHRNRYLWTASSGLRRFYLDGDLDLNSDDEYLPDSNSGGRVVVTGGGGK